MWGTSARLNLMSTPVPKFIQALCQQVPTLTVTPCSQTSDHPDYFLELAFRSQRPLDAFMSDIIGQASRLLNKNQHDVSITELRTLIEQRKIQL